MADGKETAGRAEYRISSCVGKEPYDTIALAMKVLKRRRASRPDQNGNLVAYRCTHCGKYHIGNGLRRPDKANYRAGKHGPNRDIR